MASFALGIAFSCSRNAIGSEDEVAFIQDAGLEEERQTRAPGDAIHLKGTGYRQTDNVMLTFTWETGDVLIPLGKASGIYAKKLEVTQYGITAALPYRYPAADVEVSVMREGHLQKIGELKISDGQSPKELRLYGVSNTSKSIDGFTIGLNNVCLKSGSFGLPENFHSVLNVPRSFGLCGISGKGEHKAAVYVDFFTGEAETLASDAMALLMAPANYAVAVVCRDEICTLRTLPIETGSDYMTKSSSPAPVQPKFTLPEGLKSEYFGDYPGVFSETMQAYLLSANRGDGNWTTVILDKDGFRQAEDIEAAAAVIPFRIEGDTPGNAAAGYIATYEGGPSLFHTVDAESGQLSHDTYTCKMGRIISATSNPAKPGHLLINFAEASGGTHIYDLDWSIKSLSPISLPSPVSDYAEVLTAN